MVRIRGDMEGGAQVPTRPRWRREMQGESRFAIAEPTPWWGFVAERSVRRMVADETVLDATAALRADQAVARHLEHMVGTNESRRQITVDLILSSFLGNLLVRRGAAEFDGRAFDELYAEFRRFFDEDTLLHRCVVPIGGLVLAGKAFDIDTYVSLSRISDVDASHLMGALSYDMYPSPILSCDVALQCTIELPKVIGEAGNPDNTPSLSTIASSRFENACTVLRLILGGNVDFDQIQIWPVGWQPSEADRTLTKRITSPRPRPAVTMTDDSAWEIVELVSRMSAQPPSATLMSALRRFNFACERDRLEDRFVDHMIALESLLLADGERQELGYRLRLRGAVLLGDEPQRREEIAELIKYAYGARSRIVHGAAPPPDIRASGKTWTFPEFVDEMEAFVRSTIRKVIELRVANPNIDLAAWLDHMLIS
jgi:hypothetical protein